MICVILGVSFRLACGWQPRRRRRSSLRSDGYELRKQFLSQIRIAELTKKGKRLDIAVHDIPVEQDQDIDKLKLATMRHNIVTSTPEQLA
jgi:hypothetical protein